MKVTKCLGCGVRIESPRGRKWCSKNCFVKARYDPPAKLAYDRQAREKLKAKVFQHYGYRCVCCGETRKEFLTLDHIAGGGTKHRKEVGEGNTFYRYVINQGFPGSLRTLCYNCNCSRGHFGYCPHEKEKSIV